MAITPEEMVQRELNYAIVDEVDSILIDEARTPLIISGQAEKPTNLYYQFARVANRLKREADYTVDEKPGPWRSPKKGWPRPKRCWASRTFTRPNTPIWSTT